ncbi:MAG: alanyl-tRNA editing protein [Candidatus Bathyarchaeia archaeon]
MLAIETRTHTALHVLKGAAVKVLGARWTAGVHVKGSHGRLTLQFDRKPTPEEVVRIAELVNSKIMDDAPVEVTDMERREAEEQYGDAIYDLFPIPSSITRLSILHIPDWNVNACNKQHTPTTAEIGRLTITKTRHRATKGLLEISYDIQ